VIIIRVFSLINQELYGHTSKHVWKELYYFNLKLGQILAVPRATIAFGKNNGKLPNPIEIAGKITQKQSQLLATPQKDEDPLPLCPAETSRGLRRRRACPRAGPAKVSDWAGPRGPGQSGRPCLDARYSHLSPLSTIVDSRLFEKHTKHGGFLKSRPGPR